MVKHLLIDGKRFDLVVRTEGKGFTVTAGERTVSGERSWTAGALDLTIDGRSQEAVVIPGAHGRVEVWIDSERHLVEEERRGGHSATTGGTSGSLHAGRDETIVAPMPAKVLRVAVAEGEAVEEGQTVVVLESMKMEFAIHAPAPGRVKRVRVAAGDMVVAGVDLVELEPQAAQASPDPGAAESQP